MNLQSVLWETCKLGEPSPCPVRLSVVRRRAAALPDLRVLAAPSPGCGVTGRAARTEPA